jgi:hypothetical protein
MFSGDAAANQHLHGFAFRSSFCDEQIVNLLDRLNLSLRAGSRMTRLVWRLLSLAQTEQALRIPIPATQLPSPTISRRSSLADSEFVRRH